MCRAALSPSDDPERGPVAGSRAGAIVRPGYGVVCTRCGIVGTDARPFVQMPPTGPAEWKASRLLIKIKAAGSPMAQ
jgi:hypothetical protein